MTHIRMWIPALLAASASCMIETAAPETEVEAEVAALTGNWRSHPTITSSWHCGKTRDASSWSAQSCVILQGGSWQSALVVRNRAGSAASASGFTQPRESANRYDCPSTRIAAGDFAACFSPSRTDASDWSRLTAQGEVSAGSLRLVTQPYAILLGNTVTTLYSAPQFTGSSVALVQGVYDIEALEAVGIRNDDVSSLKVSSGFVDFGFADSRFVGPRLDATSDRRDLTQNGWSKRISSLIVTTPEKRSTHTSGDYTLTLYNVAGTAAETVQRMVECWSRNYPRMAARFNPQAQKSITIVLDPDEPGIANTARGTVIVSGKWMRDRPFDADAVTHEVAHIVQSYTSPNVPGWVTEGLADYMRYRYGIYNQESGWALPSDAAGTYTDGYGNAARFFVWLENHKRASFPVELNEACRNDTYTSTFWSGKFGKTVDTLWQEYVANPAL